MSTLAVRAAGAIASTVDAKAGSSLVKRLLAAREDQAKRRVLAYLSAMDDARLHLQAELLRDAFHGTLSHELCSPLAAIQGSVSVMSEMPAVATDDRLGSLVEAVTDEVARLDGYIRNLLNATRVTAGAPRLFAQPRR